MKRLILLYLVLSSFIGLAQETKTQLTTRFDVVRNAGTGQNTAARIANAYQELSDGSIGVYPVVTTGTDTYAGSLIGLDGYSGRIVFATFPNNNTGASTLNLNSIGATAISKDVSGTWTALSADDILSGKLYRLYHDGTRWQIDLGGSGGGGSFTLTDGELTTVGGDATSVDVGGTASADVDLNMNTHELSIHGGTYNTIEGSNEQVIRILGSSGAKLTLSPTAGAELDGGTESATLKGASIALNDNGDVGGALDFIKSDGASGAVWGTINADDLATLTASRTMTSADDLDQIDNLRIVYTDCAAPCDVTVDLLSTGTQVTIINNGASTATLIEDPGNTTLVGTTVPIASGESALIIYETPATPDVYLSTGGGGGSGTVTSVAASVPSFLSVSGSPITTSGTLAISLSGTALPAANGGTGLTSLGTGVATWLGTPSWTNFNSAITGTAPFYSLASGGAMTADNTLSGAFNFGFTGTAFGVGVAPGSITANTKTDIRGLGTTTQIGLRLANSSNTERFAFLDNGNARLGQLVYTNSTVNFAYTGQSGGLTFTTGGGITLVSHDDLQTTTYGNVSVGHRKNSNTSATTNLFSVGQATNGGFNPTSGTQNMTIIKAVPTINATGTHSGGTLIAYEYDPILTSTTGITTHLAWRNKVGSMLINGTTITASTLVDQRGLGTTSSTINHRWANSSNTVLASLTDDGTFNHVGNVVLTTAGNKIFIKEGSNGSSGQTALTAGVAAITISGLTTSTRAQITFVSIGGTVTTTWQYKAVCTANTLTITAIDNTGATNTLDTSTLNYLVIEPAP